MYETKRDQRWQSRITLCKYNTDPDPIAERNTKPIANYSNRKSVAQPNGMGIAKPGVVADNRVELPHGWPCDFPSDIPMD